MLPEKNNKNRFNTENNNIFNSIIAILHKSVIKIRNFNREITSQYKINPLLLVIPFLAGIVVAISIPEKSKESSGKLEINAAGLSGGVNMTNTNDNSVVSGTGLLAQVDSENEEDIDAMIDEVSEQPVNRIEISDEMRAELSEEEIKIFELFSEMAEVQAQEGMDSPRAAELSEQLDGLIEIVKVQEEAKRLAEEAQALAEEAAELENGEITEGSVQSVPVAAQPEPRTVQSRTVTRPTPPPAREAVTNTNATEQTDRPTISTNPVRPDSNTTIPTTRSVAETAPTSNTITTITASDGPADANAVVDSTVDSRPTLSDSVAVTRPTNSSIKESTTVRGDVPVVRPAIVVSNITATTSNTALAAKNTNTASSSAEGSDKDTSDVLETLEEGKVRIKTNDGIIDINELLIALGKELNLNYYFEDGSIPSGRIMLQQYGEIDRSELLPLLISVLAKSDYYMVKEGPYTKIMRRDAVQKNSEQFTPNLNEYYDQVEGSVVTTIVTLENVEYAQVEAILEKFIPHTDIITPIDNTNKLVITDYASNLDRILEIIKMVDVPGPRKELLIITPKFLKPDDTKTIISDMYEKLYGEEGISESPQEPEETPSREDLARMSAAERNQYILRMRNATRGTQANQQQNQPVAGPDITIDKRTGRMFIIGNKVELSNVESILELFDVPKSGPQANWQIYSPKFVDSKTVVDQIKELMKAVNEVDSQTDMEEESPQEAQPVVRQPNNRARNAAQAQPQPADENEIQGMFIHVDDRTNRIIVLGWKDQVELFTEILGLFDIPLPGGEILLETIGLENTEAADTLGKVKDLLGAIAAQSSGKAQSETAQPVVQPRGRQVQNQPNQQSQSDSGNGEDDGPFMLADERLNRIFIIGVKEQIDQARELTEMIDQQWPGSEPKMEIFHFEVVEVEAIAEQITRLIEALNSDEYSRTRNTVDTARNQNNFNIGNNQRDNRQNTNNNNNNGQNFLQAGDDGPFLMADSRLNRLFVVGLDDQIEQVRELIHMLDKSIGLKLNIFPAFKYILSSDAANQISRLLSVLREQDLAGNDSTNNTLTNRNNLTNRNQANNLANNATSRNATNSTTETRTGISEMISVSQRGPFLLPDDRTNRLLIVSTQEQYDEVLDLIPILDIPPSKYDDMTIEIYEPKKVPVTEVQTILDELGLTQTSANLDEEYQRRNNNTATNNNRNAARTNTNANTNNPNFYADYNMIGNIEEPQIYVTAHESSNRLFIYAAKYQHEEIAKMIEKIDVEPNNSLGDYEVFSVKHRKPEEMATVLNQLLVDNEKAASEEVQEEIMGKAVIVPVTDTPFIVVRADQQKREYIANLIEELDKAMPQVLIEAMFIQITLDDSFKLGVSMQNSFDTGSNTTVSGISPLNLAEIGTNSNNVAVGEGGTVAFFHDGVIHATLEALSSKTNSEVTSRPRILVNNNSTASFTSNKQKPTTKTTLPAGSDTPIIEFAGYVDAGTTLTITPQIGVSDKDSDIDDISFISLEVEVNVDSFDGEGSNGIPPGKSTNNISTNILIPDGATIILGGLTQSNWSDTVNKIPVLGDIPLLGTLFRNKTKTNTKTVLYLFIKATVAFDPNKDPNFEALKEMSKFNEDEMNKLKESFSEMPIIPGFNDKKQEITFD